MVKFRSEISNSRKFQEMFNQLFDDLNYNNIINSNEIIELDDITNNKNILHIYNETKYKIKHIKEKFYPFIQETFEDFGKDFINKTKLTNNFWSISNLYKNILNFGDEHYNNNISEINYYILENINNILDNFNSSLIRIKNKLLNNIDNYEYYSINYIPIYNNYFSIVNNAF